MNTMKTLLNGVVGLKVPTEFAAENYDYKKALLDEMRKLFCDKDGHFSKKMYRRNKDDVFDLISEVIDEILPAQVAQALESFCEIRQFNNGDRPRFRRMVGHQRGKQFVTRVTEAGDYEYFRLDHETFDIYPVAIGGAFTMDFERYLEGVEDLSEGIQILQEGMIDRIFEMVQDVLLKSWNMAGRPSANKVAVNAFDADAMRTLIRTISPYGSPVIYCTPEFATSMTNVLYNTEAKATMATEQEKIDIRDRGFIGRFYGCPIIVMPQSFTDDTNTKLVMDPCFAYVIPAGKEKLIKLCFEGETEIREDDRAGDWSTIWKMYRKVGVGMVGTPNYWGIYYNAGVDAGGWSAYNTSIVGVLDD